MINKNSLIPAIKEGERFINFLNNKFKLGLPQNFIISFNKQKKNKLGDFTPKENPTHFIRDKEKLHTITINTLHLKGNPYETLAHELAHFVNEHKGVKDCTSNQYHNKKFKVVAEKLLLKVEKLDKKGYSKTSPTEEFKKMLKEFKQDTQAFKIFQETEENAKKQTTRNYLFTCENECFKVRCGDRAFNGICSCGKDFKEV